MERSFSATHIVRIIILYYISLARGLYTIIILLCSPIIIRMRVMCVQHCSILAAISAIVPWRRFARRQKSCAATESVGCYRTYTLYAVLYVENRIPVNLSTVAAFYRPTKSACFFFFFFITLPLFSLFSTTGHDYILYRYYALVSSTMQLRAAVVVHEPRSPYRIIIMYVIMLRRTHV